MAGLWGKRKREEQEARDAQDADLARRAKSALVAVDERIRIDDRRAGVRRGGARGGADARAARGAHRGHAPPRRGVPPQSAQPRRDPRHARRSCARATRASCSSASGPTTCWMTARGARRGHRARAPRSRDPRSGAGRRRAARAAPPPRPRDDRASRHPLLGGGAAPGLRRRRRGRAAAGVRRAQRRRLGPAPRGRPQAKRRTSRSRRRQRPCAGPRRSSTASRTSRSRRSAPSRPWPTSSPTPAATSSPLARRRRCPAVTAAMTALEAALKALPARRRQDRPLRRAVAAARGEQRAGCRDRQGARAPGPPDPLGDARASRAR